MMFENLPGIKNTQFCNGKQGSYLTTNKKKKNIFNPNIERREMFSKNTTNYYTIWRLWLFFVRNSQISFLSITHVITQRDDFPREPFRFKYSHSVIFPHL